MAKFATRWIAAAVAVIVLSLSTAAFAEAPCANLTVSLNRTVATHGDSVTVTGSLNNCSDAREKLTIKYTVKSPCYSTSMGSFKITLDPDETRTASVSYVIPAFACTGVYKITAQAFSGTTLLATSSVTLTVH